MACRGLVIGPQTRQLILLPPLLNEFPMSRGWCIWYTLSAFSTVKLHHPFKPGNGPRI